MAPSRRQFLSLVGGTSGGGLLSTATADGTTTRSEYTTDSDLRTPVATTAAKLDEAIAAANPGTPLAGLGEALLAVQAEYGINAVYQAAHAAHESAWGRSRLARQQHNLFGCGTFGRAPGICSETFTSDEACLRQVMAVVDETYLAQDGQYYEAATLDGMNAHYTTDPRWDEKVARIMRTIGTNLELDDPTAGPAFATGDPIVAAEPVNLRTRPVVGNNVTITYPRGSTGVIVEGPQRNDGHVFWKVEYDDGSLVGWTAQSHLEADRTESGDYRFRIQQPVRADGKQTLRTGPGEFFERGTTVENDAVGYVEDGPIFRDETSWWKVAYNTGVTGWSRSAGLASTLLRPQLG